MFQLSFLLLFYGFQALFFTCHPKQEQEISCLALFWRVKPLHLGKETSNADCPCVPGKQYCPIAYILPSHFRVVLLDRSRLPSSRWSAV